MGRIFEVQAKNLDTFRRKKRRKLRKGDVIRIYGIIDDTTVKELLDIQPTNNVLKDKRFTNQLINDQAGVVSMTVVHIGLRTGGGGAPEDAIGDFSDGFSDGFTSI